jgi:membrane protease YdiL (CAAX protease family)
LIARRSGWAAVTLAAAAACARPVATARTSPVQPPMVAELEARIAVDHRSCPPSLGFLFPGLGQLCLGKTAEGATMAALAAAQGATAVAVALETRDGEHPGVVFPLAGLQDLYVYGLADVAITGSLARGALYAPQDSLLDLAAAPFNHQVMKRPGVWGGLLVTLAVGLGASIALGGGVDASEIGEDPNLFGHTVDGRIGYPLGGLAAGALFSQVAGAEEALFRGFIQSSIARTHGETAGWIGGTILFGAAHAPNALALDPADRRDYLVYGLPIITAAGAYLGWLYRQSDYSLAPPTALHFWYDFLLSTTLFVLEPQRSIFAARLSIPF